MRTCDRCQKTFPIKDSLRQHRRKVHKIPANLFPMECDICHKMELSVALSDQHFRAKHETQLEKICIYCGVGFDDAQKFFNHLLEKHELSPPIDPIQEKTKPISSAFNGALKVFKLSGSGENDLMQFMTDVKPQIDQLVSENVNRTSQKMHLVLRTELSNQQREKKLNFFSDHTWYLSTVIPYRKTIS